MYARTVAIILLAALGACTTAPPAPSSTAAGSALPGFYSGGYDSDGIHGALVHGVFQLTITEVSGDSIKGTSFAEFPSMWATTCTNVTRPVTGTIQKDHLSITIVPAEKLCQGMTLDLVVKPDRLEGTFTTGYGTPSPIVLLRK